MAVLPNPNLLALAPAKYDFDNSKEKRNNESRLLQHAHGNSTEPWRDKFDESVLGTLCIRRNWAGSC